MAAANKTQATVVDPAAFIATVADPERRDDAKTLVALMARVSSEEAAMWGPSIVGFGRYRYRYDSGREGEMCRIGFSPRAKELVLYILHGSEREVALLDRLGKHRTGKGCLYVKRLADIDAATLEALVAESWAEMARRYPA